MLPVQPLDRNSSPETALEWVYGIIKSNELELEIEDQKLFVKGKDFPRHALLLQGNLEENFIKTAQSMGWDILPLGGQYLIEFPLIHTDIIETLINLERYVTSFDVNLTVYDEKIAKESGLRLSKFTDFVLTNFDALHASDPQLIVSVPSIKISQEQIDLIIAHNISCKLSGLLGETVSQRIDLTSSFITTSRDALGQNVNQSVTSFTSGLIIELKSYPLAEDILLDLNLELSQDVGTQNDPLPVIARKALRSTGKLDTGEVWEACSLETVTTDKDSSKSYFIPWSRNETTKQKVIVTIKRTK